jgi:hemoglobin-like flavoprotein
MGTIYGVTVTSAIVQNVLLARLPETLGDAATEEVSDRFRAVLDALSLTSRSSSRNCESLSFR